MDLFSQLNRSATDDGHPSAVPAMQTINLPKAQLHYFPALFDVSSSDRYFQQLLERIAWSQQYITFYGKTSKVPRLSAWYGEPGKRYTYSGISEVALPWIAELQHIKQRIEQILAEHTTLRSPTQSSVQFNSVLANLYRDGADSVAWHCDDEPELGRQPVIASLSFGQERDFHLRAKEDHSQKYSLTLAHGSCLIMSGDTQHYWQHQIPKTRKKLNPRINLTFRMIK